MVPISRTAKSEYTIHMNLKSLIENNVPKVQKNLVSQLTKIKKGLAEETMHNKAMLEVYRRYVRNEATQAEMDGANQQFTNFLKTIGLGVLAVLPFSPITIPAVVNLGKKFGIDVLPDSFNRL